VGPGSVHVERYGHGGLPVVLLHGFGTCTFLWRAVAPLVAAARHTAFAVDLLGHGESDRPLEADFGVAAQAEYLDRAMTVLRVARALVVGVDVGGGVALRLAATRPDRVAGLILVNTVAFDDMPGRDVRTLQRNTARFVFRLGRGVFGAEPLLGPVLRGSVADSPHARAARGALPRAVRRARRRVAPARSCALVAGRRSRRDRPRAGDRADARGVGGGGPVARPRHPGAAAPRDPGEPARAAPQGGAARPRGGARRAGAADHRPRGVRRPMGLAGPAPGAADLAAARAAAAFASGADAPPDADDGDRRANDRGEHDRRRSAEV
jgi:pimeloyl-ACP methyl ester carboxylesterase